MKREILTKAQFSVMADLANGVIEANIIKPATLGFLCANRLVDVSDGVVSVAPWVGGVANSDGVLVVIRKVNYMG